jgi:hypothetical protein
MRGGWDGRGRKDRQGRKLDATIASKGHLRYAIECFLTDWIEVEV